MRSLIFIIFFLLNILSINGQNSKVRIGKIQKYIRKGDYLKAADNFDKYLQQKPNDQIAEAQYSALLYFDIKNYEKANPYIKNALKNSTDTLSFGIPLLRTEIYLGNFIDSKLLCEKLIKFYKRKKIQTDVLAQLNKIIEYNILNNKSSEKEKFYVGNLGNHINSPYADYVPITNENEQYIWLTSKRKLIDNEKIQSIDNTYKEKMFSAKRNSNGFDTVQLVHYQFKENKTFYKLNNESFISVSQDGNQLFLFNEGTIWRCINENGKWGKPSKFEEKIMDVKYTNHGSVSADGKYFYFSSEIDGKGGLDLFYTSKNKDGNWSQPVNIESLNTKGNEQGPFICPDGKTLYFSSDSLEGFGGYDIYKSTFDGINWSKPENIGKPFNSQADDIFYMPKENKSIGYLSSNRKGTIGNYDIYRFFSYEKHDFDSNNIVNVKKRIDTTINFTLEGLNNYLGTIRKTSPSYPLFFKINDTLVCSSEEELKNQFSNNKLKKILIEEQLSCENCAFKPVNFHILQPSIDDVKKDNIVVSNNNSTLQKNNEVSKVQPISNENTKTSNETEIDINQNTFFIRFDFNKNSPNQEDIDKLVTYLKNNASKKLNIYGHTDSRGKSNFNLKLSKRRAYAVKKQLILQQVNKEQILEVKGFGETKPIIKCEPNCDSEDFAKNRRVEVNIVSR